MVFLIQNICEFRIHDATKCLQAASSTPNGSLEICNVDVECSPDVSVIEPSDSSPCLCDPYITELNRSLLKKCVIPKDSRHSIECTRRGISLKKHCVQMQCPEISDKGQECKRDEEELEDNRQARSETYFGENETKKILCEKDGQESAGTSRAASSSACSEAAAGRYYHHKLLATTQILKNKEETVRVQAASLAEGEARAAALAARCHLLTKQLDHKTKQLQTLESLKTHKIGVSSSSHAQVENRNIINALQNNLSVIEELYRECFYEAAKQESLIEMLRQSCMEVRARDRDKAHQIGSLHGVINTQRWSLDRCQDISLEVDNLKSEISNFLNSSNNDSGMWEESSVAGGSPVGVGVSEELQDILQQLLRLRELLTTDCTCGLEEENKKLMQTNENMKKQIDDLQKNIYALETTFQIKNSLDQKNEEEMLEMEKELKTLRDSQGAKKSSACSSSWCTGSHAECTCDLIDENKKLRQTTKEMETQIKDQEKKISELEMKLRNKSSSLEECKKEIDAKEKELQTLRKSPTSKKVDACSSAQCNVSQSDCTCELQEENNKLKLSSSRGSSMQKLKIDACSSTHSKGSQADCTCQLEEENMMLKLTNGKMETQISDQRKKISDLEMILRNNNSLIEEYKVDIAAKETQFVNIKKQLSALEKENRSRACDSCVSLTLQLQQTQVQLNKKMSELSVVRAESEARACAARRLQRDLDRAVQLNKECEAKDEEVCELRAAAVSCRLKIAETERRAAALEADLRDARAQLALADASYSAKVKNAEALERQLEQAHERGAALCEEARHAVCAVRRWATRVRTRHREQEQKLKEKKILLKALQSRLKAREHDTELTSTSDRDNEPSCSQCVANRSGCSLSAFPPCDRQREQYRTSASEIASCSSASLVPPNRLVKKKLTFHGKCGCLRSWRVERRDAGTEPATSAATSATRCAPHTQVQHASIHRIPPVTRELCPSEELHRHVEHLGAAFHDCYRRWTTRNNHHHHNNR